MKSLHYLSNTSGTGVWRHIFPSIISNTRTRTTNLETITSMRACGDIRYYQNVRTVWLQGWNQPLQAEFVKKFLSPTLKNLGGKLIYEMDDAVGADDIPTFNMGHSMYQNPEVQKSISDILELSDRMVVSTEHLGEYYQSKYNVPAEKIIVMPNLLPVSWMADKYIPSMKQRQFQSLKSRPRVGIISSACHWNIKGEKDKDGQLINDDISTIERVIRDTVDEFMWVFIGQVPNSIQDLVQSKKVQVVQGVSIWQYPSLLFRLGLQMVVAPLQDIEFNRCKSNIKYLECSALGIPLIAPDMLPYSTCVPERFRYKHQDELLDILRYVKFMSSGAYTKVLQQNYKWLCSPFKEGGFEFRDHWMDNNIRIWEKLYMGDLT